MTENENDGLLLLLVLFLSKNRRLMEDIGPVLDFLEEHKATLSTLEKTLSAYSSPLFSAFVTPQAADVAAKQTGNNAEDTFTTTHARNETNFSEKEKSPLEGIANEEILRGINAYFAAQNKPNG